MLPTRPSEGRGGGKHTTQAQLSTPTHHLAFIECYERETYRAPVGQAECEHFV